MGFCSQICQCSHCVVVLHTGKELSCRRVECHLPAKSMLSLQAVKTKLQVTVSSSKVSPYREAYQNPADIIAVKILYQLCFPQGPLPEFRESHVEI